MHDEAGGEVERRHLLKIQNLQLQRRKRTKGSIFGWLKEVFWTY